MNNKYQESLDRLNTINMVNFIGDKELIKHKDNDIKTLQELVDKETPMKVRRGNGMILCCKCNKSLYYCYGDNYCSNCGQKIDFNKDGDENVKNRC